MIPHAPDPDRLDAFLSDPARPDGTLSLMELHGLLFALQGAPRLVPPSEMLPLVFAGESAGFDTIEEAQAILPGIIGLGNEINEAILERAPELPAGCKILDDPMANFDPSTPLAQWSRGFEIGYRHVEEDWADWLPVEEDEPDALLSELSEGLGATLMILTLFASREKADDFRDAFVEDGTSLERVAAQSVLMFTDAMRTYGNIGRSIHEAVLEDERERARERDTLRAVGRNAPCPCGSGKKVKKCCGKGLG